MNYLRVFASFVAGSVVALALLAVTFALFIENGSGESASIAFGTVLIGGTIGAILLAIFARGPRRILAGAAAAGVVAADIGAVVFVYESLAHMTIPL